MPEPKDEATPQRPKYKHGDHLYLVVGVGQQHTRRTGASDEQVRRAEICEVGQILQVVDDQGVTWTLNEARTGWNNAEGDNAVTLCRVNSEETIESLYPFRDVFLQRTPQLSRNSFVEMFLLRKLSRDLIEIPQRIVELKAEAATINQMIEAATSDLEHIRQLTEMDNT